MDSIGTRTVWDCNSGKEKTRVTSTLLADPRANPDIPVLLIWDVFSGHWTSEVQECAKELNVVLLKVFGRYSTMTNYMMF
ncbi:hypothetical protein F443_01807 [Phytophthora nicotianae P1569]|uniref:DDE-1 domain-containing protein n=1 Tax=Phytophthora nicotianae P1569 TaxID=1317065 RepID=V9FXN9_PHYNI|nr:hypothetical protein F443_01807 [Phytophthora nicotianae P1569]